MSGLTAIGTTALSYNNGTATTLYSGEGQTLTLGYADGNETFTMPAMDVIPLLNGFDNSSAISANRGSGKNVILTGRTLQAGRWNTLCVPFNIGDPAAVFGAGTLVKTLSSYANDGTTVTISFSEATTIVAGTPYIIMLPEGASNIQNPTFNGVTIDNTMHDVVAGGATFKGCYSPVALAANDRKKLFLADNMLWYPNADVTVKACRAYFELTADLPELGNNAPNIIIDFGDATGITTTNYTNSNNEWFTVDGRKLLQKPVTKGMYINDGRKVVIK